MPDRHDAALRAALAERKRLIGWIGVCTSILPAATDYLVARIVEAALAAADAHTPSISDSPHCGVCHHPESMHQHELCVGCGDDCHALAEAEVRSRHWAEAE